MQNYNSSNVIWNIVFVYLILSRLLKGRSFPGKVLLTQKSEPLQECGSPVLSPIMEKSYSENDIGPDEHVDRSSEVILPGLQMLIRS